MPYACGELFHDSTIGEQVDAKDRHWFPGLLFLDINFWTSPLIFSDKL